MTKEDFHGEIPHSLVVRRPIGLVGPHLARFKYFLMSKVLSNKRK